MELGNFLEQLGLMVVAAAVALALGRFVKLPGVVCFLVAGVVIGLVFKVTTGSDELAWVLETGISLMLFLVGLEMNTELLKHLKGKPLITGFLQVLVMTISGAVFLRAFNHTFASAMIGGLGFALSSTVVVLKLLQDRREMRSAYGQLSLAILLTQDLVVIVALTILEATGGSDGGSSSLTKIGLSMLKTVASFGIVLMGCYVAWRFLLRRVFEWRRATPDLLLVFSLAWCFAIVYLAHYLHLSAESGAFLAGLAMAGLPHHEDLRRRVHPLMQFFVAIFFVSLASSMELDGILKNPWFFAMCCGFVLILKPAVMLGLFSLMKWRKRVAPKTALVLGQISEFSLILLTLGAHKGLVSEEFKNLILVLALVSFPINIILFQWIFPSSGKADSTAGNPSESPDGELKPIIVIGMNTMGRRIVKRLIQLGEEVIAVDTDPKKLDGLDCQHLIGSTEYQETLHELHFEKSKLVISALRIEESNELIAFWSQRNGVPACIHGVDMNNLDRLLDLKVAYLILPKVDGIKSQVNKLKEIGLLKS